MDLDPVVVETLRESQRFGFFGPGDLDAAIAHAGGFVAAIGDRPAGSRLLDLGSGGGLPGLVIAALRPEWSLVLLDRQAKRTDFLRRAVSRLGYDHVDVWCDDAREVVAGVTGGHLSAFDIVTARGFGPPTTTLRVARALIAPAGVIVISDPPDGDRWDPELLVELGLTSEPIGRLRRFTRT